jgi:hypothetical protein
MESFYRVIILFRKLRPPLEEILARYQIAVMGKQKVQRDLFGNSVKVQRLSIGENPAYQRRTPLNGMKI